MLEFSGETKALTTIKAASTNLTTVAEAAKKHKVREPTTKAMISSLTANFAITVATTLEMTIIAIVIANVATMVATEK